MVQLEGDEYLKKLTPVSEGDEIPPRVGALLTIFEMWIKGQGITVRAEKAHNAKVPFKPFAATELRKHLLYLDKSETEHLAVIKSPPNPHRSDTLLLKRTDSKEEADTLFVLKTDEICGFYFGGINTEEIGMGKQEPYFTIREFVPGVDHRSLDLAGMQTGLLKKLMHSAGEKMRLFHNHKLVLGEKSDLILDVDSKTAYFTGFRDAATMENPNMRAPDIMSMWAIIERAKPDAKDQAPVLEDFFRGYGNKHFFRTHTIGRDRFAASLAKER